jgi:DNA mismatch repair protein MutS2
MFLIDEFAGSDPELVTLRNFLEEFYHRNLWNHHYTFKFKILATNDLPFATNTNMMFDEKSLEPCISGLGSSRKFFTFEVALKTESF